MDETLSRTTHERVDVAKAAERLDALDETVRDTMTPEELAELTRLEEDARLNKKDYEPYHQFLVGKALDVIGENPDGPLTEQFKETLTTAYEGFATSDRFLVNPDGDVMLLDGDGHLISVSDPNFIERPDGLVVIEKFGVLDPELKVAEESHVRVFDGPLQGQTFSYSDHPARFPSQEPAGHEADAGSSE